VCRILLPHRISFAHTLLGSMETTSADGTADLARIASMRRFNWRECSALVISAERMNGRERWARSVCMAL
jgi:hypothetical protein